MKFIITSFPSVITRSDICLSGYHHFLLNPTKDVSYLVKSSSLKPKPLLRSGYITSVQLPWSINNLLTKKPPILEATMRVSSCGCDVPSMSSSPKAISSLLGLSLFSGQSLALVPHFGVMLRIPFRWLVLVPKEVAWITSIIPRVEEVHSLGSLMSALLCYRLTQPWNPLNV